jgi:lysophospholipase L1-like esterase
VRKISLLSAGLLLLAGILGAFKYWSARQAESLEPLLRKFEDSDRLHPADPGTIVFTGSSSIALWNSLADDMRPLVAMNRGISRFQISDVNQYAPRIVIPYRPRAVVLYAGDNDLSPPVSKSPETVAEDFRRFVNLIHPQIPDAWIYFVSIKPSPSRWSIWPSMQRANELIAAYARTQDRVEFIDVSTAMLTENGSLRRELFLPDDLHLSARGYALWTSIIRPILLKRFG